SHHRPRAQVGPRVPALAELRDREDAVRELAERTRGRRPPIAPEALGPGGDRGRAPRVRRDGRPGSHACGPRARPGAPLCRDGAGAPRIVPAGTRGRGTAGAYPSVDRLVLAAGPVLVGSDELPTRPAG